MTLSKQTLMIVIGALIALFIGTFFITVYQSKLYFEEQLQRNAQDTATSLGLSLSEQFAKRTDTATILGKVNAVFDRGYLNSIVVTDINDKILVARSQKERKAIVPQWFRNLIPIQNAKKSALILSGWQQVGKVTVQSDSDLAFLALWQTTLRLFFLFLALMLLITLISVLLIKITFKPLKRITQQARDIGRKNFYELKPPPRLKELRELSDTINNMVRKLKGFFDQQIQEIDRLRKKSYQDNLTGLGNRRYFFQQLNHLLSSEEDFFPGHMLLIELAGMASFNSLHGYFEGDQVIKIIAEKLNHVLQNKKADIRARLDGPKFGIIIHETHEDVVEALIKNLSTQCNELLREKALTCNIGAVNLKFAEDPSQLLIRADQALRKASQQEDERYFLDSKTAAKTRPGKEWQALIKDALNNHKFFIYAQPVQSNIGIYHKECFLRLQVNHEEISAREFMPLAEAYDLSFAIDQFMLQKILCLNVKENLAVNLSAATVGIPKNRLALINLIQEIPPERLAKIHFELSEHYLTRGQKETKILITELTQLGAKVGLDRVAATLTSFNHLKNLNLSYLKLDGSFANDLKNNMIKQELIMNLLAICRNLDITLIATAIESESQLQHFKDLGITHYQGHYVQSPVQIQK
ncbi:EAL domain-containing protein [Legionella londiniensis]|uniref:Two component histidine kinase n=1 Tax=Legionella londiniensis TaxID=45068 RepID=A0A0W0VSL0_9GAMM|nr:EAL domain-containing protein [Legionella londiniensis]KTD22614.1 two component histidine kinase [Legionella londiniensis]STX92545.1 two component histidine kinase, GGDEF domain protein/EAL domain protein [Legionella londiniensis]